MLGDEVGEEEQFQYNKDDELQEQEEHDIALDKLSVKEYEDPFKGSK